MVSTVKYYRPSNPAGAAEFDAFLRLLPDLRTTHPGQYVANCGGEIVASGSCYLSVELGVKHIADGRAYYCDWVEPPEGYNFSNGYVEVQPENP